MLLVDPPSGWTTKPRVVPTDIDAFRSANSMLYLPDLFPDPLQNNRTRVADVIARQIGQPVDIDALVTSWDGWNPKLDVRGMRIIDGAALHRSSRERRVGAGPPLPVVRGDPPQPDGRRCDEDLHLLSAGRTARN